MKTRYKIILTMLCILVIVYVPIIALTGDGRSSTEKQLEKLHIPIIYKPFRMNEIIEIIQS
ncbi:MAG: hypothetical protein OEQ12_07980 [Nitrosopumilus sp.]|nr:hypothetical protein [Nitrosopumilus sp.]